MATAVGQLETHSILDCDQIIDLCNSIDGYEDTVAGFWDQRYAFTFPANHGWQLYRQKFVYHDVARNPKLKHDALMRRWGGLDARWFKVVMREDKKDSQSPKQLEQQASNYARIVVEEFPLEGILIQTTIGDTFRTWWFDSKKSDMEPLFGQEKYSKRSYININSLEGSAHWNSFVAS
ncbi:hypothetical protein VFPPC_14881 [Pochonia chlamydosporia 170]|uniref:Uncharacterized protein n=1 Tax=Pochonia chlamydosporia 170 TaxID=1380566 RepID=A0A179FCC5_METCM|nr:hypothetical protein VFPPC_14881 [Pochonia chlamydosporia 170]OAQ62713.1 hypothetical protein VFPPC_14881 [Pochonia chlamydosporia 170]